MSEPITPFQTVKDILDHVLQVHHDCQQRFAAAAADCREPRRKALLSYLADREADQIAAIGRLRSTQDDVLASFVQSVPANALAAARDAGCDPDEEFDELVAHYTDRDRALLQLFDQLEDTVGPRASTIFADLAAMRRKNQARLREALLDF